MRMSLIYTNVVLNVEVMTLKENGKLKRLLIYLNIANVFDIATTIIGQKVGLIEVIPFTVYTLKLGLVFSMAIKFLVVVVASLGMLWFWKQAKLNGLYKIAKWFRSAVVIMIIGTMFVVLINLINIIRSVM